MADIIKLRRDTAANWTAANPILAEGEMGIETDTKLQKNGDGTTAWNSLPYMKVECESSIGDSEVKPMSQKATTNEIINNGSAFDISAYNATDGQPTKYADLSAALAGNNVPTAYRKGGMSVKFVQSSDNKYVQYFSTKTVWSASAGDWEKMNLEEEVGRVARNFQVRDLVFDQNAYLHDSGNIVSYKAAKATSEYYPINDNIQYTIVTGQIYFDVNLVCFYDVNKNFISGYKNVDGESFTNISLSSIVSIPSNAVFVRFSFYTNIHPDYQVKIEYSPFALKSEMQECEQRIESLQEQINNTESIDVLRTSIINSESFERIPFVNDSFLSIQDGNVTTLSGYCATDFVSIDKNKIYAYRGSNIFYVANIAFYDDSQVFISALPTSSSKDLQSIEQIFYPKDFPNNAKYIRFGASTGKSSGFSANVVCCYPSNINIKEQKRLITKTIHFIGDSVMIGRDQVESVRSLTYFLQNKYGLKCINHGAGGAILTSSTLHYAPIYNQLTSLPKDADYIIMQGGLNGISQEATSSDPWGWGEISDSFETNFDTVLQIPCLEAMCKYVVTKFPNKKWGFIINYQIGSYAYWQQKSELIKQVLDKWSIPYLDWRHTGINLASKAICEKYGVDSYTLYPQYSNQSTYNLDDRVIYDGKTYKANTNISTPEEWNSSHWDLVSSTRYDSWHCNALAYEQLADKTYDWIKSL